MINRILNNIRSARFDRREFSGSLGDMGLYLPLVTAFVTVVGMDLGAILFFSGFFNILSGLLFGIPVCVQPMKAIAAVAISEGLSS
ncbi:MAG: putative sulfate/molybdate transporter, partial [Candidatus Margulisiibacteriota bacterium]